MKSDAVVGVRALRTHLSAYLRDVAQGHTVTIGDRQRRPIARLVPVTGSPDEATLDRLAEEGAVRRGVGKPGRHPRVKPRRDGRLVSDIVITDRE